MDVIAPAEVVVTGAVEEEAWLGSVFEPEVSSSEDVTLADRGEDAVAVGACERSDGLSSCRRTAC